MVVVRGEGSFADAVRRVLEYAQSRGIDLSGVEVEVVADPSITDFGAYTEHHGGLKFRIRYNPRYNNDVVLAAHEAGHVAYWAWQGKKGGGVRYVPDIDEPLVEGFGAVVARQVFGVPVTFKGAPHNLTKILPERTTYITVTVGGKPVVVKVPEWSDYKSRYKAGVFVAPYFYNMTNWAHVFGNVTAAPTNIINTVHDAWRSGAVEFVPGWGPVWRKEPTWSWPPADKTSDSSGASTQQKPSDALPTDAPTTTTVPQSGDATQKNDATTNNTLPQVDVQKAVVHAQPSADVPLPPSNVRPPKYFSSDITPRYGEVPEWDSYISSRRVLVVFRNWPSLDTTTLKETRRDHVAGAGVVSGGSLRFEGRIPIPSVVDPNAWIEVVDEKTGKVLARLRSYELYKLTSEGAPLTLYWSHVAMEERWPGWERFVERAKELEEKLGTWRPSGAVVVNPRGTVNVVRTTNAVINPDSTVGAVKVANVPTEYVPPKVPDDVRRQFENLLSDLKKLGEGVNLRNVGEVHDRFIQLRDKALEIARAYPQLIDEASETVGRVGGAIRDASSRLYDALAKAAGRDSFWRGDGDVKTPIGVYKYDPATGAFLLSLYDRPVAENIVGYIKDDGTPVVLKKTQYMSEALEEYNKLLKSPTSGQDSSKQTSAQQSGGSRQVEPQSPLDALTKVPVLGPVLQTAKLFSQTPSAQSSQQTDFLQPLYSTLTKVPVVGPVLQTARLLLQTSPSGGSKTDADSHSEPTPVVQTQPQSAAQPHRQRIFPWPVRGAADFLVGALKAGAGIKLAAVGITALGGAEPPSAEQAGGSEFVRPPSRQQKTDEFVAVGLSRPLDYELIEEEMRKSLMRPPDYVLVEMRPSRPPGYVLQPSVGRAGDIQLPDRYQETEYFVEVRPLRPLDYVLAEEETRRAVVSEGAYRSEPDAVVQTSSGYLRPVDYVLYQQSSDRVSAPSSVSSSSSAQLAEVPQTQVSSSESKKYRGRPVVIAI